MLAISVYSVIINFPNSDCSNEKVVWWGGSRERCLEMAAKFEAQGHENNVYPCEDGVWIENWKELI